MLSILVGVDEYFNEETNEFIENKQHLLQLEHSLLSVSKWESIWKVPFLHTTDDQGRDTKTIEQTLSYIECMTLNKQQNKDVYKQITHSDMITIQEYINDKKTASFINRKDAKHNGRQKVTSELIYYWMVAYQIPWEAQKWHLSRLSMLIEICNEQNKPKKKMSKSEILSRNAQLNANRLKGM